MTFDSALTLSLVRAKGVLPIMDYTGMLGLKGVGFSGFRHIKGALKLRIRYKKWSKTLLAWCLKEHFVRSFEGIRLLKL